MKIALVTEGTYPFAFGGVSVWCDQLIRGMPGYEFHVVALTAAPGETAVWALPGNVASVTTMPLWGPAPARRAGRHGRLPPRLLAELIDVLLGAPADTRNRFGGVLRELHEYCSAHANLSASLASGQAVRLLAGAWLDRWPRAACQAAAPTLHDAV